MASASPDTSQSNREQSGDNFLGLSAAPPTQLGDSFEDLFDVFCEVVGTCLGGLGKVVGTCVGGFGDMLGTCLDDFGDCWGCFKTPLGHNGGKQLKIYRKI